MNSPQKSKNLFISVSHSGCDALRCSQCAQLAPPSQTQLLLSLSLDVCVLSQNLLPDRVRQGAVGCLSTPEEGSGRLLSPQPVSASLTSHRVKWVVLVHSPPSSLLHRCGPQPYRFSASPAFSEAAQAAQSASLSPPTGECNSCLNPLHLPIFGHMNFCFPVGKIYIYL